MKPKYKVVGNGADLSISVNDCYFIDFASLATINSGLSCPI